MVGTVAEATPEAVGAALAAAPAGFADWSARAPAERSAALRAAADAYEANAAELTALATREAGKTLADAIAEVREAVDFLRYYADAAEAARPTSHDRVLASLTPREERVLRMRFGTG